MNLKRKKINKGGSNKGWIDRCRYGEMDGCIYVWMASQDRVLGMAVSVCQKQNEKDSGSVQSLSSRQTSTENEQNETTAYRWFQSILLYLATGGCTVMYLNPVLW